MLLVVPARRVHVPALCPLESLPAWFLLVFVDTMATRDHSKSRSPVHATRRDAGLLSQASTVAASSQLDALMLAPTPARGDFHSEWLPDGQPPPGTSPQVSATPVSPSPFAHVGGPTYRGVPPTPAPAPVSGPSPTVHLVNTDPFARKRLAAVQPRVAAPVISDPRPPPPVPAFSPFRDGHYCRMSQTNTIAASSQPVSLMLTPTPARADLPDAQFPALPQSPGAPLEDITTPIQASSHAQLSGPTYRGDPPQPAPAPVSGPSPPVHLAHADPFARARIAAVQSRVAASVLSDPRPPPPAPVFSPFRDGHYWCSKCPRRGITTIPGLMRHVTHQHAGSTVDEATCSLFTAIERVTCTAPACGGLRRVGARVCNRCGQASQARPPRVGDIIMGPLGAPANGEDTTMVDAPVSPLIYLPLTCRATSRSASARFPHTPFCMFLPAAACA